MVDEIPNVVFVVHHEHELAPDRDDVKMIGVYSSKAEAEAAVARLSAQPGFRETTSGFSIDRYRLDEDHWVEGFITMVGDKEVPP